MVAPIDSRADLTTGDETFTLAMNFRTIALAESVVPGCVMNFPDDTSFSATAALVWAFAQPAQPKLSQDQAAALLMRHGEATMTALRGLFVAASADEKEAAGDAPADPPKRGQRGGG